MITLLLNIDFSLPLKNPVLIFSILLFIILLSPILLRRLRLPGIIGLIISGVIIGPHGFNLMERNTAIILFGTVGLIYIMFLAGLELDLNEFRKNRYKSLLFGLFTFALPLSIGFPVCYYFLQYDFLPSLLIASMFATHTLVAYPIASRLGISKNEAVAITVGGTIITDTAVLLILAVITGSQEGGLSSAFWIKLIISLIIFGFIVFWVFPPVARWFFKNIEGEKTSPYIFVLALVFLAAFLAEVAGVEPIIGAFMAGLALNSLIPHTSALMNRIEFVGNALFIPFFLISVGMLVDVRVLLKGPQALIVAGTLTVVAITGKWLAAWLTQRIFHYTVHHRNVIFGLSSAHAAATLAVILIGFQIKLLDENVLNGTIILILITCLVGSFVTESAGRKLAIAEADKLPELGELEEKFLVPVANPTTIEPLMDLAMLLKNKRSKQPITALSVVKDDAEAREKVLQNNKMLEKAIVHAAATDTQVRVETRVALNASSGISQYVQERLITTIIMGWSGKSNVAGTIFGTTLDALIARNASTIVVANLCQPLNITRRITVIVPANAQYEVGFPIWVEKLYTLAKETSATLLFRTVPRTWEYIMRRLEKLKSTVQVEFDEMQYFEDISTFIKNGSKNDILIVISAREATISYDNYLDKLPGTLPRYFKNQNFMVIYPEQSALQIEEDAVISDNLQTAPPSNNFSLIRRISNWFRIK
ncbi:MAG: cation:proton antiporter [Saprospiraceae bacterium]